MLNVTLKPFSPLDDILDEVIYYEKQKNNEMDFNKSTLKENLTNKSTRKLIKFLKNHFLVNKSLQMLKIRLRL